jgi:hypothetical protein
MALDLKKQKEEKERAIEEVRKEKQSNEQI